MLVRSSTNACIERSKEAVTSPSGRGPRCNCSKTVLKAACFASSFPAIAALKVFRASFYVSVRVFTKASSSSFKACRESLRVGGVGSSKQKLLKSRGRVPSLRSNWLQKRENASSVALANRLWSARRKRFPVHWLASKLCTLSSRHVGCARVS